MVKLYLKVDAITQHCAHPCAHLKLVTMSSDFRISIITIGSVLLAVVEWVAFYTAYNITSEKIEHGHKNYYFAFISIPTLCLCGMPMFVLAIIALLFGASEDTDDRASLIIAGICFLVLPICAICAGTCTAFREDDVPFRDGIKRICIVAAGILRLVCSGVCFPVLCLIQFIFGFSILRFLFGGAEEPEERTWRQRSWNNIVRRSFSAEGYTPSVASSVYCSACGRPISEIQQTQTVYVNRNLNLIFSRSCHSRLGGGQGSGDPTSVGQCTNIPQEQELRQGKRVIVLASCDENHEKYYNYVGLVVEYDEESSHCSVRLQGTGQYSGECLALEPPYTLRPLPPLPPHLARALGEEVADQDFGAVEIGEEGDTDGNLDSASSKAATEADASAQQQDRSIIDPNEIDLESEVIDPNGNGLENEVIDPHDQV